MFLFTHIGKPPTPRKMDSVSELPCNVPTRSEQLRSPRVTHNQARKFAKFNEPSCSFS
jgi:hypothetical protein